MRIVGVGPSYARLLEAAGVDSVPELAQRNPAHLHAALDATDAEKSIVRQRPGASAVADWVAQATRLERVVSHSAASPENDGSVTLEPGSVSDTKRGIIPAWP